MFSWKKYILLLAGWGRFGDKGLVSTNIDKCENVCSFIIKVLHDLKKLENMMLP